MYSYLVNINFFSNILVRVVILLEEAKWSFEQLITTLQALVSLILICINRLI